MDVRLWSMACPARLGFRGSMTATPAPRPSPARTITVTTLLLVTVTLIVVKALGQQTVSVLPGLVLMTSAAVALLRTRRRWAAELGILASVVEILTLVRHDLPSHITFGGEFSTVLVVATWVRLLATLAALAGSLLLVVTHRGHRLDATAPVGRP